MVAAAPSGDETSKLCAASWPSLRSLQHHGARKSGIKILVGRRRRHQFGDRAIIRKGPATTGSRTDDIEQRFPFKAQCIGEIERFAMYRSC